jgi:hypothetical protein
MLAPGEIAEGRKRLFAGISALSTRLSTGVERWALASFHAPWRLWISVTSKVSLRSRTALIYTGRPAARAAVSTLSTREANVSAERAPAEAPARIPGADVHARGSSDPQAPPRQGSEAPLRVTVARLRLAPAGETMFLPRAPFFETVRIPLGSLTHPPHAHAPRGGP